MLSKRLDRFCSHNMVASDCKERQTPLFAELTADTDIYSIFFVEIPCLPEGHHSQGDEDCAARGRYCGWWMYFAVFFPNEIRDISLCLTV